jgi:hypothetical protein
VRGSCSAAWSGVPWTGIEDLPSKRPKWRLAKQNQPLFYRWAEDAWARRMHADAAASSLFC